MTSSQKQLIIFSLALSFSVLALQIFSAPLLHNLSFWPERLTQGELWRLATAHLIHFNALHCAINLIAFWAFIFVFYWKLPTKILIISLIFCSISIDVGLFLFGAANQEYIGFSGTLHGLAVAGACYNQQYKLWRRAAFVFVVFLKVSYENFFATDANGLSGQYNFIVAVDAHAYGAISGIVIGCYLRYLHKHP